MKVLQQDLLIDGDFEGIQHGSGVSFLLVDTDEVGYGPRLHRHPYTETSHHPFGSREIRDR